MEKKKYLFLDLDNTIYPVISIGEELFNDLFEIIKKSGAFKGDFELVKRDIMRKPFQVVAARYQFSEELLNAGIKHLENLEYMGPIRAFEDFKLLKNIPHKKFLVTTGFSKLQWSKIRGMGLEGDFADIRIIDPLHSGSTKKNIFQELIKTHGLTEKDILVVGDDPESELRAAEELGLDAVLYDKINLNPQTNFNRITDFSQLRQFL